MSTSPPPQKQKKGFKPFKGFGKPEDWVAASLTIAKAAAAGAEASPIPYVKVVFGTVVVILETIAVCDTIAFMDNMADSLYRK
jgi:hypothetical protein